MIEEEFYNPLRDNRRKRDLGQKAVFMDMNAMVDLAFLLLTIFMLTTIMIKTKAIELVMPLNEESAPTEIQAIKESRAMTIIPLSEGRLFFYHGLGHNEVKLSAYGKNGIKAALIENKNKVIDAVVIIKPHPESTFENLVDLIEVINITRIDRYAISNFTEQDQQLLQQINIPAR
ncbi:MAG: ExbD/TolR family protein [Flavobacteriales bacterium]